MPRETPGARQPHKDNATDVLALWRCNEASAVAFTDERAAYTTTLGTLPPAAASVIGEDAFIGLAQGARDFDGSTHFATAPGNAAAGTALAPATAGTGFAIEAWVRPDVTAFLRTIVAYGGQSELETGNTLAALRINGSRIEFFYEHGAGVDVTVQGPATGVLVGLHHLAVVVRRQTSTIDVELYKNGEMVARQTGLTPMSGGGTSPLFAIGRHQHTGEATGFFDGRIDDVRITKVPLSAAAIRDSYARGARRFDYATMYASGEYSTHVWVYAQWSGAVAGVDHFDRGVGYIDLTNIQEQSFVVDVDYGEDVDDVGMSGTLRLRRKIGKLSIAPGFNHDLINDANFLELMQHVQVWVADVPVGYSRAEARIHAVPRFDGVIGSHDRGKSTMVFDLVGREASLIDTWIEEDGSGDDRVFGSVGGTAMQTVLQNMLDTFQPSGGYKVDDNDQGGGNVTLKVEGSPSFNIKEFYTPTTAHVLGKCTEITELIAWSVRYKWDDFRKEHRFTLFEPDRTKVWSSSELDLTNGAILDWESLKLSRANIRNVVDVEYGNQASTDNTGAAVRAKVTATDATSISKVGRRYCKVGVTWPGPIDTNTEAQRMADGMLSDLKDPKAEGVAEVFHRLAVELGDMARARADAERFKTDTDFAVTSWRAHHAATKQRTTIGLRGAKPSGGFRRWFDGWIQQRGHRPGKGKGKPPTPSTPTLLAISEGLRVSWTYPVNKRAMKYLETEIHASTTTGFTPSSSTLQKTHRGLDCVLKGLDPTQTWFVKLVHKDAMQNASAASVQSSTRPRYFPKSSSVKAARASDINPGTGKSYPTLDAETNDVFGDFAAGVFTTRIAGLYVVAHGARFTNTGANDHSVGIRWDKASGATYRETFGTAVNGTAVRVHHMDVMWLAAGESVRPAILVGGGVPTLKNDADTFFSVSYLPAGSE